MIPFVELHWAEFGALACALGLMLASTALIDLFGPQESDLVTRRMIFLIVAPIGFVTSFTLWLVVDTTPDLPILAAFVSAIFCALGALGAPYASRVAIAVIKWKWPGLNLATVFDKPDAP